MKLINNEFNSKYWSDFHFELRLNMRFTKRILLNANACKHAIHSLRNNHHNSQYLFFMYLTICFMLFQILIWCHWWNIKLNISLNSREYFNLTYNIYIIIHTLIVIIDFDFLVILKSDEKCFTLLIAFKLSLK